MARQKKDAEDTARAEASETDDIALESEPPRLVRIVNLSAKIGRSAHAGGRNRFEVDGAQYPIEHVVDRVAAGRAPFRVDRRFVSKKGQLKSAFLEAWGPKGKKTGRDHGLRDYDALNDAERRVLEELVAQGHAQRERSRAVEQQSATAG